MSQTSSQSQALGWLQNHYEIMTPKITLKIFVTLKRYGNHTENIYKGNHSDNHTEIFSFDVQEHWNPLKKIWNHPEKKNGVTPIFCSQVPQRYSRFSVWFLVSWFHCSNYFAMMLATQITNVLHIIFQNSFSTHKAISQPPHQHRQSNQIKRKVWYITLENFTRDMVWSNIYINNILW